MHYTQLEMPFATGDLLVTQCAQEMSFSINDPL